MTTRHPAPRPCLVLADDHTLVAAGLAKLLEENFDLLAIASDGADLVAKTLALRPDAVVLDISMPRMNGLQAGRKIREALPQTKLIFLTVHTAAVYVTEAFRAGASAYVVKKAAAGELVIAIREALQGRHYVTKAIGQAEGESVSGADVLTARQTEVLRCVAKGLSGKEIAATLNVSAKTIEFHKSAIMQRLGVRTTAELTRYALERGLLDE